MWNKIYKSSLLYNSFECIRNTLIPYRSGLKFLNYLNHHTFGILKQIPLNKLIFSYSEVAERITRDYPKPEFGICSTFINQLNYKIEEEITISKPFCKLVHFKKTPSIKQHKLLIIAPLSGHYATLLRGTVKDLLPYYDVYITDWISAKEVPLSQGDFGFNDYINYCIEFMEHLEEDYSAMAVCQPSVPLIAATAIMSSLNSKYLPENIILMGGPIDVKENPTKVNIFATKKDLQWFENNFITRVPINFPGFMRPVYPGFLQITGFISMNLGKHIGEHTKLFQNLLTGNDDSVENHKIFYDEYLAVMDLPAKYYIETVDKVFKKRLLPKGQLYVDDIKVDLSKINKTNLLVIEGEKDDITGLGQTKAAINLCTGLKDSQKHYHLQKDVGHYGLFNGSKYRTHIVPLINDFINNHK